jgi:glutamate formiminotransferase/glutamate formiminotransferase/formiminotetrahydrofolate cyclodeaminase
VLECVVNVSEGMDSALVDAFREVTRPVLLDLHADPFHNRSVLTLAGEPDALADALAALTRLAVASLDVTRHAGAHPRLGVVDVVPFVDLDDMWAAATPRSLGARDRYAAWAAGELDLPCFLYGPERTLPEVRRAAWRSLLPDCGPARAHPTAGAVCVGARGALVAYNLVLNAPDLTAATQVAASVRRAGLRTLALVVGPDVQVSCNLTDPRRLGPADAYDLVARALEAHSRGATRIAEAELVGLLPRAVLAAIPSDRWPTLGIGPDRTIEARLEARPAG